MRKIWKTLVVMLMVFSIVSGLTMNCAAVETEPVLTAEKAKSLNEALQIATVYIDGIDFSSLRVGRPIQTYEYVNQSFLESIVMYPLTVEGRLVLLAIENGEHFQITDALVDEINGAVDSTSSFSIVYDNKNCYLYADNNFILLCEGGEAAGNRDELDVGGILSNPVFSTTSLTDLVKWKYEEALSARVQTYYSVPVIYKPQIYDNICWAASVAMIVNCVTGRDLSAVDVARKVFSWEKFNYPLYRDKIPGVLATYGVTYTFKDQIPSDNVILQNIKSGYPIYASFYVVEPSARHGGVIYGVNVIAGYVYVMDPAFGSASLSYDANKGTYTYISAKSGYTYELASASAYDWS